MRRTASALSIMALASLAACSANRRTGPPTESPLAGMGTKQYAPSLVAVGPDVDVNHQRAQGMGLVHAPKLQASLQAILDKLAAQAPVQGMSCRVYIRAADTWGANASADANVYLNLRTIRDVESEDEMAAVLAHELSHVILEHHDADALQSVQERAIQLSLVAAMASGMAGAGAAVTSATQAIYAGATSLKATQAVVSPAWQRDQEAEADVLAADLLVRAGWDPHALATALAKQQANEVQGNDDFSFTEKLKEASMASVGSRGLDSKKLTDGLTDVVKQWVTKTAIDLAKEHPDTGQRITDITAYVDARYPAAERPARSGAAWSKVVGESSTRKLLTSYTEVEQAEIKLVNGDRRGAEKHARAAASGAAKDHARPVIALAAVQEGGGRQKEAMGLLQTSIAGPEPSLATYREAARMATRAGDTREAVRLLELAWTSLDRPPEAIPPLLQAYKRNKQDAQASLLSAECTVRYPKYHLAGLCSTEERRADAR